MNILVIGGTGTLGSNLLARLSPEHDVTCISRDEQKQQAMKRDYPRVKFALGDIRDPSSIERFFDGMQLVFHVAALKHVDVVEDNPQEAIKTNIYGTINVADAAMRYDVPHVIFSSTDKAVLPINVYGMTKGISERYLHSLNDIQTSTKFVVYRWGNVAFSRGSVIHSFASTLQLKGEVNITDERMTRFMIHIDEAVEFMLSNYRSAGRTEVMIPPMKAAKVVDLARATASVLNIDKFDVKIVGIRPGEKIHECIESNHDFCVRSDTAPQFTDQELRDMVARVLSCA